MVCFNTTKMVFALLLMIAGSAAEKGNLKINVHEDELFWSRHLQEPMSVPAEKCVLDLSITCSVGEGIECGNFQTPPDRCLQDINYIYTFENNGTAPLTIIEAISKITGEEPTDLIRFVAPKLLQPGQSTTIGQQQRVNYCSPDAIIAKLVAKANPGGCEDEVTQEFQPSRSQALRGK